jgi:pimeloyl-ACP methyl ester carboxylesterase
MSTNKPTIMIIGGGWHTPTSYTRLIHALELAGYEVHCPQHPSISDARPPTADLATDTAFTQLYVENLISDGRCITVIMHSYGGQVGTNALHGLGFKSRAGKGLTGGITNLIYMAAFALPEGKSMVDKVREFGHEELLPLAFDFADDKSVISRDPAILLVGPGTNEKDIDEYVNSFKRWNGKCMYDAIQYCSWRKIDVGYILTTKDMTVPLEYQKSMVKGMRNESIEVKTWELETGHCPNFTATEEVVNIIGKFVAGG